MSILILPSFLFLIPNSWTFLVTDLMNGSKHSSTSTLRSNNNGNRDSTPPHSLSWPYFLVSCLKHKSNSLSMSNWLSVVLVKTRLSKQEISVWPAFPKGCVYHKQTTSQEGLASQTPVELNQFGYTKERSYFFFSVQEEVIPADLMHVTTQRLSWDHNTCVQWLCAN